MAGTNKNNNTSYCFAMAIMMIVTILAACIWYYNPVAAWVWIKSILVLPAMAVISLFISFFLPFERVKPEGSLTVACSILAIFGTILWINLGPGRMQE